MAKRAPAKRRRAPSRPEGLARIEAELEDLRERQALLFAALGLKPDAEAGDRGVVGDLNDAVLRIQDYLLRTSERIDKILSTLKNHRELLVKMNQRIYQVGTRERIRMELDILKNTASVLAMNGIEVDEGLLAEIQKVRDSTQKDDVEVAALRESKAKLDKRFDEAVRKFDLTAIYRPRKHIPGYR